MRWTPRLLVLSVLSGLLGCAGGDPQDAAGGSTPGEPGIVSAPADPDTGVAGPTTAAPASTAPKPGGLLVLRIGDSIRVGDAADPLVPLPLDVGLMRGTLLSPLFDLAKETANRAKGTSAEGGPRFAGKAEIHIERDSPIIREDLYTLQSTLGQAQFADFRLFLGDQGPLEPSLPSIGPPDPALVEPRIAAATILLHRDLSAAWATATATWSEAKEPDRRARDGMRPDLTVPLAGDAGCYLLRPGPSRNLGPGIHARLHALGVDPEATLSLAATPHTAVTDELHLALDLQARGWTMGRVEDFSVAERCPEAVRSAAEMSEVRVRFEAQTPSPGGATAP